MAPPIGQKYHPADMPQTMFAVQRIDVGPKRTWVRLRREPDDYKGPLSVPLERFAGKDWVAVE